MTSKAEQLAQQLLEKTEAGKLLWNIVPDAGTVDYLAETKSYRTDLEDGYSFSIGRLAKGDNKVLTLSLSEPGRVVLSAQADNFTIHSRATAGMGSPPDEKVSRFRLFSDLFRAAQRSSVGGDQTIEKVQQLLERLG
jgi:hypothetical protein